jgi:hypothetical protein
LEKTARRIVHDWYSLPNITTLIKSRRNDVGGASGRRRVYRILVGKPEEVRQLGRNRRIEEDYTKMTL